ncbi:MAG: hypothetical protein KZQ76_07195 [Candidatus Thiodiazotropha sp. (ex Epidulcina cf. delphinae)]|nr:hypothetical protein [Candidatus Thiodiazotropha sp. (ex Epidulcina cf. delphinae)]
MRNERSDIATVHSPVLIVILFLLLPPSMVTMASDDESCLMCHKMPGLGRYAKDENQNATKRILYVNEALFKASYHGRLPCKSCHRGVDEIPHTDAEKVDCASDCHIKDPSSNSGFSHRAIVHDLSMSAHGARQAKAGLEDDLPDCKYCHSNKPYQRSDADHRQSMKFLNICLQCHESEEWAERFYKHISYRASIRRSSKQIVELCSQCHADRVMMDNHELDVVVGFNDTFHGKAIRYGDAEVANCLNCHAPYESGFSPHSILSQRQSRSPVSGDNKIETCRQSGCHTGAKEEFATSGKIHPASFTTVQMMRRNTLNRPGDADPETAFQEWVLHMISLFYKTLIIVVVGGLALHQVLDVLAIRRERRARGG